MAEVTTPKPPPEDRKKAAVKAWHDAADEAAKRQAVKDFPELASIYSEAQNYR